MKTILNIHQLMMNSHSKVYQGYSKGIRFAAALLVLCAIGIGNAWGTDYELVTSASSLASGDHIIIVNGDNDYAISTTQNNNNRAATSVSMSNNIITPSNTVQVLTLGVGSTESSYWTLSPSSGNYLYAASSSKNYLRTQSSIDVNAEWEITIDANGDATVIASGSSNRNEMKYNANNGSPIFSCYSTGGTLHIYKEAASNFTVSFGVNTAGYGTVSPTSIANVPSGTAITKGTGANVNKITINGTTVTATPASQDENYNYTFSSWSVPGNVTTVTSALTITANFTRTARPMTNYRTVCDASAPTLTVDPSSLTGMGYKYGESPTAKSFSMSGANLTSGTLTVTAPTNYEVSKESGSGYAGSITFTGVSGTLSATTVYVRLKSGKAAGDYNDEKVSISGCGLAVEVKVNCSGTVYYEDIYKTGLHTSTYSTYASGVSKTGTYTVPSLEDVSKSVECEGLHYHFAGWVTNADKEAEDFSSIIAATGSKTANNTTYWAVWVQEAGEINYTKVTSTSAVVDGVYVIINNGKYLPNATTDSKTPPASGDTYAVTLSLDGNTISSSVTSGMKWYFTMSDGKATIMNAASSGSYLYEVNDGNGIRVYTTSDTWTIEENSTGFALQGTNNSRYCAIYDNTSWRSYTTKDHANYEDGGIIYLYKETIEYEDPVTECPELTCGTPTTPTSTPSTYSATLGWTEASPGTKARYEYIAWPKGTDEPTSGYSTSETTSGSVSGLLSNTEYRWKVRKVCTGTDGESGWLKSSFTTTGATVTFVVPEGVSAVSSQSTSSAMPSAGVPSSESKCWAFLGWTTAAYSTYSGSSAPAKLFPNGTYAHLTSTDGTTFYAVYGQTEYELIYEAEELVANDNYVLTFEDNDDYIWALSNEDYETYAATITNVTSKAGEDAYGYYLYNVGANNVWKFTGTASSGQLYNATADKYLNLSSTSAKILNTTNNLTFTPDGEGYWDINATNYLNPVPSTSYEAAASASAGYSAIIYHETNATYTTSPDWTEYTIAWKVQGEAYTTGSPSDAGTACSGIATMPTAPSAISCSDVFVGWCEEELFGTGNAKPRPLFNDANNAPTIDENKTFHAVFASYNTSDKQNASVTSEFTSMAWADANSLWTSGASGHAKTGQGVQITTSESGANATTNDSYMEVSSVVVTYSTNAKAGAGTIAIEVGGTSMTGSAAVTNNNPNGTDDRTITYTHSSSLTGNVKITVTCTTNSIYIKSVQINYKKYGLKDYITACTNEFTTAGNWNTAANWSLGAVPTIHQPAIIKKAAVVNTTTAKARSVVIYNDGSTNTGSLEISAGQALVVAETVRKTTNGSTYSATGENDIVFGSTLAAGTGALVMNGYTSGDNKATVNFAVKAKKDNDGWVNQFIGTPFNDQGAVLYNYYGTQLYAFHPAKDGSYDSGTSSAYDAWWSRLAETDGMDPFMGYNILCSKAESPILWMQGTLNATSNVTLSSANGKLSYGGAKTENLIANSWMAPIHISAFEASDFSNVEQTIYIFNAGRPGEYVAPGTSFATTDAAGQYNVLPIASAPFIGAKITVIPAMQAFSVYATGANPSLTLNYNRLVYTPALTDVGVVPTRAPRRAGAETENAPEVIRLRVAAESGYAAKAYILGREDFNEGFDDGWDGRFMEGDYAAPQLYAPTENGNMVINCVPEIEGTVLCFKPGTVDSEYTFSFGYEGEESWYLNDEKEQESTLITPENTYTFATTTEDNAARFVISRTPIYKTPTGMEDNSQKSKVKSRKMLIDGVLYIIRNGLMYDVTGALCK